ncbi:MAG: aminotransferase, partial [Clostridia bacterium]|nr:aminotransferase [Clostridia bacterium]
MQLFTEMTKEELCAQAAKARDIYDAYLRQGISINMARGRPAAPQLDLSDPLMNLTKADTGFRAEDGTDVRNYGGLCGLPEARRLFGEIFGVPADNVIVCGSSSLNLMYDYISQCYSHGALGSAPWIRTEHPKFVAVVPGYDRHFAIAERFGLEMISVPMTPDGPDMDLLEEVVKDPSVKGMFCVPKYSNPDGITYSENTVRRLAAMQTGAADFRVIWDEAYVVHDLYEEGDELANVFEIAKEYGTEDRFVAFASTSKITFAGAGVAAIAASD